MTAIPLPVPVSASVLVDRELTRRAELKRDRKGNILTGCREIDEYALLGGFERGSVVGVSCEDDEVGLLIGLQTVAHLLVTALLEDDGASTYHSKVTIITMSPVNVLVPKLRQILVNQLASYPAGLHNINSNVKRCLERISISMVFDIQGLQEVLGEIKSSYETTPAEVQEAAPAQDVNSEPVVPVAPKPQPLPASPPPARIKTEIRDSEDEDEDEDPVVRSASSSPLSDPPEDLEDLYEEDTVPKNTEVEVIDTTTEPQTEIEPPSPPPLPPPPKEPSQPREPQPNSKPPPQPKEVNHPPDLILITHMTSLMNALFTGRDKPAAHEIMSNLSDQLREVARPASSSDSVAAGSAITGPLVMILNSTTSVPSKFDPVDLNKPGGNFVPTTERSIFQHNDHQRVKHSFGVVLSQLVDLHLLCTRIPRRNSNRTSTRTDTKGIGANVPYSTQYGTRGMSSNYYAWVVEVLLDELGVYEIEYENEDGLDVDAIEEDEKMVSWQAPPRESKIRRRCREQRWGAVEVEDGGGRLVDVMLA